MMIHEKTWSDFVLALDFKISKGCNSGVFIRTYPLTPRPGKDVGFNGIEVAIDDTSTAGYHDTGAFYDLVKPSENAMKPVGQWNHMVITCDGPKLSVELNGETGHPDGPRRVDRPQPPPRRLGAQVRCRLQEPSPLRLHRPSGPRLALLVQEHQDQAAEALRVDGRLVASLRWRFSSRPTGRRTPHARAWRNRGQSRRGAGAGHRSESASGSSQRPGKTADR